MKRYGLKIRISGKKVLIYITAILFILNSASVYITFPGTENFSRIVAYGPAFLLLLSMFAGTISLPEKDYQKAFVTVGLLALYLVLFILLSNSALIYSLSKTATILMLILYIYFMERRNEPYLLIAFRNLILIIAISSLFFWVFGTVLKVIPNSGYVSTSWTSIGDYRSIINYYKVYFESDVSVNASFLGISNILRNASIFTEGGFAAFNFSIGMLYELFIEREKSKFRLVILTLAVGSTLSTTGFISIIMAYLLYYLANGSNTKYYKVLRFVAIPVFIAIALYLFNEMYQDKILTHSGISRMSDYINGFMAWKKSPLFGYGYGNHVYINRVFHTGYSNSITAILTQGGLAIMLLYLLCYIVGIINCIKGFNKNRLAFIIAFIALFAFMEVGFLNITIYLILYFALYTANADANTNKNRQAFLTL